MGRVCIDKSFENCSKKSQNCVLFSLVINDIEFSFITWDVLVEDGVETRREIKL